MAGAWETVIGLETHVQLRTVSKMFCGCSAAFGAPPNTNVCPVCLGLPGALPMPNEHALKLAARAALGLGCTVHPRASAARTASCSANPLAMGSAPGRPRHTGQTFVLGGAPNAAEQPQNIFDAVLSWQWTSMPMTAS